ncbi:hypothetical protein N9W89_07735 [Hellea sp.]|nr:hypothetical protein [Hellea sp.]
MKDLFDRLAVKAGLSTQDCVPPLLPQTNPFNGAPIRAPDPNADIPMSSPKTRPLVELPAARKPIKTSPSPQASSPVHVHHHEQIEKTQIITPGDVQTPEARVSKQIFRAEREPSLLPQQTGSPPPTMPVDKFIKTKPQDPVIAPAQAKSVPILRPASLEPLMSADQVFRAAAPRSDSYKPPNRRAGRQSQVKFKAPPPTPIKISIGDIQVTAPAPATLIKPSKGAAPARQNVSNLKDYLGWKGG